MRTISLSINRQEEGGGARYRTTKGLALEAGTGMGGKGGGLSASHRLKGGRGRGGLKIQSGRKKGGDFIFLLVLKGPDPPLIIRGGDASVKEVVVEGIGEKRGKRFPRLNMGSMILSYRGKGEEKKKKRHSHWLRRTR